MEFNFRPVLRVGLFVVIALLAFNAIRLALNPKTSAQGIPVDAYTVVLREEITKADGQVRQGTVQTRAVRADGSTVLKLGPADRGSRLISLATGIEVMTNDRTRVKSTVRKAFRPLHRTPESRCLDAHVSAEKFHGEDTVGGYRAARVTVPGDRPQTHWYALDHGCAPLKSRFDFGGREASEWQLVGLFPGDPQNLFTIPDDYREGPPSLLEAADVSKDCGPECQEKQKQRYTQRDAEYFKRRP